MLDNISDILKFVEYSREWATIEAFAKYTTAKIEII